MSVQEEKISTISVVQASEILGKSIPAVRQLIHRNKLNTIKEKGQTRLDINEVMTYHARKKDLPSWDENITSVGKQVFVPSITASSLLMVQESYIAVLIRNKHLEGYVTADGEIMVSRESINNYLRKLDVDTRDL